MARKSAKPQHVEPEDISPEVPEEEPERDESGGKAMSKAEAIRRAVAAGMESPEDGVGYIRDHFGLEVSKGHFSATRSQIKSKGASTKAAAPKGKPGHKPKEVTPSPAVEGYLAPPPSQLQQTAGGETDLLAAMEVMKPLVASLGADKVKRIVDLLG